MIRTLLLFFAVAQLASAQTRIMPLGDSITQANSFHASYRYWLWQSLTNAGYKVDFVGSLDKNVDGPPPVTDFDRDHEGHWGWRLDEIIRPIQDWAKVARPDVVLVHLGHNDLYQGQGVTNAVDEMRSLVRRLRFSNNHVIILLGENIPCDLIASELKQFAEAIRQIAAEMNTSESPVIAVDLRTGFNAESDTYDGVHPNEAGEKKMAAGWFEALRKILPRP